MVGSVSGEILELRMADWVMLEHWWRTEGRKSDGAHP